MGEERSGTEPERELWGLGGAEWTTLTRRAPGEASSQVVAVFTDREVASRAFRLLAARSDAELPMVMDERQRREDLQAEFRRQFRPLERYVNELRGLQQRGMEMAARYRRAAASVVEQSVRATELRHRLWAQATAVYAVLGVTPPRLEGIDPDPLDRVSDTTTGG